MPKASLSQRLSIFGGVMVVLGLMGLMMAYNLSLPQPISATPQPDATPDVELPVVKSNIVTDPVKGHPNRITIKSLKINLPVIDGYYSKGNWTLTPTNAQFATPSKLPNNTSGTTYLYGHDTVQIFHRLHDVKDGAIAILATDNGYRFIYKFHDSVITSPLAVSEVTAASKKPRLSLQTCYGPTSADRRVFHFYLDRVEKA